MVCVLRGNQDVFMECFVTKTYGVLIVREAEVYGLCKAII